MNTDRAAVLAETLAEYRQDRHKYRAIEVVSNCCPTCSLDSGRQYSLDAVPLLPHSYCTNPTGCSCTYGAVPISAAPSTESQPAPAQEPVPQPVSQPIPELVSQEKMPALPVSMPVVMTARSSGVPAYLKTPAAAMIVLGVAAVAFGIGLINRSSSNSKMTTVMSTNTTPQQMVPAPSVQTAQTAPMRPVAEPIRTSVAPPVPVPAAVPFVDHSRDRALEAKAARDIREAEAIAKSNEYARRAQEAAAQQQSYLRNVFSHQNQSQHYTGTSAIANDRSASASTTASSVSNSAPTR